MASETIVWRVEMNSTGKQALERACDSTGMKQVAVMSRVLKWFAAQPDALRKAVLDGRPARLESREVAALLSRRLGTGR